MNHVVRRAVAALSAAAFVAAGVFIAAGPASARPNCDVPDPPPICGGVIDPVLRLPDVSASVTGPASAVSGTTGAYAVRVANLASAVGATARAVSVRITANAGATITAAALTGWTCAIAGATATCSGGMLANGASASIPVTVRYPSAAASVTVSALVDPTGAILERSETNNAAHVTTDLTAPALPDLQLAMTGPSSVRGLYEAGKWTITVRNTGSAAASPVNVRWLTTWRGDVNANAVITGAIGFSCIVPPEYMQQMAYCYGNAPLQPGAGATIVITAVPPAPSGGVAQASTITATVDYGQQVTESNESNNAASVATTILP